MKVSAITKFKQGDLWGAIKRLGWSQSRLAKEAGLDDGLVGKYINLLKKPTAEIANKIQIALAKHGEYLDVFAIWPENFKGLEQYWYMCLLPSSRAELLASTELIFNPLKM